MVQLLETDVQTKEVLSWTGLHVFHYGMSSCSQKLRIFLNLKGLRWESHPIDIPANEHLTPYYLGINPRGLLPAIVENGAVHIESNDIMLHLEKAHPEPRLLPCELEDETARQLAIENDLHFDLRTLTFRFLFDPATPSKTKEDLRRYASSGSGTVRGERDADLQREIAFWSSFLDHGISDDEARAAAHRLHNAFTKVDAALGTSRHILGEAVTMVDIAWLVYAQRLIHAGYPIDDLYPNMAKWRTQLMRHPDIAGELEMPDGLCAMIAQRQRFLADTGQMLVDICFRRGGTIIGFS